MGRCKHNRRRTECKQCGCQSDEAKRGKEGGCWVPGQGSTEKGMPQPKMRLPFYVNRVYISTPTWLEGLSRAASLHCSGRQRACCAPESLLPNADVAGVAVVGSKAISDPTPRRRHAFQDAQTDNQIYFSNLLPPHAAQRVQSMSTVATEVQKIQQLLASPQKHGAEALTLPTSPPASRSSPTAASPGKSPTRTGARLQSAASKQRCAHSRKT